MSGQSGDIFKRLAKWSPVIDESTFTQLLEMDDDNERDFSSSVCFEWIDQSEGNYTNIEEAIESGNLEDLHKIADYCCGLAATIGAKKVVSTLEHLKKLSERKELDDATALHQAAGVLREYKAAHEEAVAAVRDILETE
ncbi:hypothetical protein FGRMN_994 [Fusarium graminum]|nr:hypothetical protein FGRMN_994 [Fusarium graminum]